MERKMAIPRSGPSKPRFPPFARSKVDSSESMWAQAFAELEGTQRRPGLWARVFAEASGEEARAKAAYLSARVEEIRAQTAALIHAAEELEHQRAELAFIAEVAAEQAARENAVAMTEAAARTEAEKAKIALRGRCSQCLWVQPVSSKRCAKCVAVFNERSAWKMLPLNDGSA